MIDRQLALDAAEGTTHSEGDDENKTNYSEKINSEEKSLRSNEQRKEEILKGVPVALRPTFESSETALEKEKEKWLAWEKKSELDIVTMNKRQNFLNMEKKSELINNPTIGPGPMTASATIVDCGILNRQKSLLSKF